MLVEGVGYLFLVQVHLMADAHCHHLSPTVGPAPGDSATLKRRWRDARSAQLTWPFLNFDHMAIKCYKSVSFLWPKSIAKPQLTMTHCDTL